MKLEEVLPAHRAGKKIGNHQVSSTWVFEIEEGRNISSYLLANDQWFVHKDPPVEIDLVEYADGYEFEFGRANHQIYTNERGCFHNTYNRRQKSVSGVIYMNQDQAEILCKKLNSGEWVLKCY